MLTEIFHEDETTDGPNVAMCNCDWLQLSIVNKCNMTAVCSDPDCVTFRRARKCSHSSFCFRKPVILNVYVLKCA